jgi:hypothetical protein
MSAEEFVSFSSDGKKAICRDVPDWDVPQVSPIESFPIEFRPYINVVWRGRFSKPTPNMPFSEAQGAIFYVVFTKWENNKISLFVGGKFKGTIVCPISRPDEFSCSWTRRSQTTYKLEFSEGGSFYLKASDGYIAKFKPVATLPAR